MTPLTPAGTTCAAVAATSSLSASGSTTTSSLMVLHLLPSGQLRVPSPPHAGSSKAVPKSLDQEPSEMRMNSHSSLRMECGVSCWAKPWCSSLSPNVSKMVMSVPLYSVAWTPSDPDTSHGER